MFVDVEEGEVFGGMKREVYAQDFDGRMVNVVKLISEKGI